MQHYPAVGKELKERFEKGNNNRSHVLTVYGHEHDQRCDGTVVAGRGCDVVLSGGGAGWPNSGGYYGFTAVHLKEDGSYETVLETSEVRLRQDACTFSAKDDVAFI